METYSILMDAITQKAISARVKIENQNKKETKARIAEETKEAKRIDALREQLGLTHGYTTQNFTKRDEQLRIHDTNNTNPVHWTTSFIRKQQAANCIW